MYVDVSVYVCVVGGEGGEGSTFNLPMGFPVGGKGIWNPWRQVGLQLLRIWGRQLQCWAGLWFGETWTELYRRKSWKRRLVAGPVPFMCEGQLCSCEEQCLDCLKIHWICAVSLSFVGQIRAIAFSECLWWVLSEVCLLLCICSWGWQIKWLNIAVGSSVTVWTEAACERPWKATLLKQTTGRQGLLQADFASVPSLSEKENESITVWYFLCAWNKVKLSSFRFLCVQTGLQWKGIIIKFSFLVVILQVFYFKWLPPECIKIERHHLLARSMEVNKSVACKRLMKGRQPLFQVFWNGENSGLKS